MTLLAAADQDSEGSLRRQPVALHQDSLGHADQIPGIQRPGQVALLANIGERDGPVASEEQPDMFRLVVERVRRTAVHVQSRRLLIMTRSRQLHNQPS